MFCNNIHIYPTIMTTRTSYKSYFHNNLYYYSDVIMGTLGSPIIGVSIVYPIVCSGADQRKQQSSASRAFVRGIPVNFPHKGLVKRKIFPFDDVIIKYVIFMQILHMLHSENLRFTIVTFLCLSFMYAQFGVNVHELLCRLYPSCILWES